MATYRIVVYAEVLRKQVTRSVVSFARQLRRELAKATPIDTGRAMAGWNATIGSPDYTEPGLLSEGMTRKEAVSRGIERLDDFQLGNVFYISNGVPYIGALNGGHSDQAPSGFIEDTIDRFAQGHVGFENEDVFIEDVE